jgi:proteasome accessory factor C
MRTFHLERVSEVALTDIPVTHAADAVPDLFEPDENDPIARIRFPASVAPLLGDYLERADVDSDGATTEATLRVADEHALKRLAARRGGQVEILEPLAARRSAATWARDGLSQYREV